MPVILTPDEEKFVRLNFEAMSVTEMAAQMKRGAPTLYGWMKAHDLAPYRGPRQSAENHPFRKANRALEAVCIQRKVDNRKANRK